VLNRQLIENLIDRLERIERILFSDTDSLVHEFKLMRQRIRECENHAHALNELENRLILVEERFQRQTTNARLREFIAFIEAFPYGWQGLFTSLLLLNTCVVVAVEVIQLKAWVLKLLRLS
jgi:hypothetical protein